MSIIIKPDTIDFIALIKSSNTLSDECNVNLITEIKKTFTEEQQQWYIANLYMYINYHPTNDYPINLESIFSMIGFANKGNAMKTIKSNFTKDEDYKVALVHTEKRKNEGGTNKEDIMLNIDTFKSLCMLAKTDKGKEIRKYYLKLENINNKIVHSEINRQKLEHQKEKEIIQLQLEENKIELLRTQAQLIKKTKLKVKKWYDSEPGHTVYAVKIITSNNSFIKLGKSIDIGKRETNYPDDMFYIKKCYNSTLAENVIHHIMDKYRIEKDKEYFDISEKLAIYIIDIVCNFLDKFINFSEELPNSNLKEHLDISLVLANKLSIEIKDTVKTDLINKRSPTIRLLTCGFAQVGLTDGQSAVVQFSA